MGIKRQVFNIFQIFFFKKKKKKKKRSVIKTMIIMKPIFVSLVPPWLFSLTLNLQ